MSRRALLLAACLCAATVNGLRLHTTITRRSAILGTGLASTILRPQPAAASKFPQHVEDLDKAARSKDVPATRDALKTLALPCDEASAAAAISPVGDLSLLRPSVVKVNAGLSSFKVTVAAPAPTDDYTIKIMWLRNPEGGGLVGVREFKAGSGETPGFVASVPKGLGISRLVPCVFSPAHGVVSGEEIVLTE